MAKDELSEIEIKLINATRKFSKDTTCAVEISRFKWNNTSSIKLRSPDMDIDWVWLWYSNNAENGKINTYGRTENEKDKEYIEKYKSFLIQEIPEIKDRIK